MAGGARLRRDVRKLLTVFDRLLPTPPLLEHRRSFEPDQKAPQPGLDVWSC